MPQINPNPEQNPTVSASKKAGKSSGLFILWMGILLGLGGAVGYLLILTQTQLLHVPWYAPFFASLGALLLLWSVAQKRSLLRWMLFLAMLAFASLQWWFLVSHAKVPAYAGPVKVGQPFPHFTASKADGSPWTQQQLTGNHHSLLVFFRGHW